MTQQAHVNKDALLNDIQKAYQDFDTRLSSLNQQQLMTVGSDGWTIKDHIAHLTAWQQRALTMVQGVIDGMELPDPTPDMTIDQINDQFHQRDAALPLDRVLAEHRAMQQQVIATVQAISEEDLNKPRKWLYDRPVVEWVKGNTYEHYEEHTQYIQDRLEHA